MKIIEPGHVYELDNLESDGSQRITFIRRSSAAIQHPGDHPGTNTQELIRVIVDLTKIVIDRTRYLDDVIPAVENNDLLWHARMLLLGYEGRAYRRKIDRVNKGKEEHTSFKERDKDLPFNEMGFVGEEGVGIENLPVGFDGHIEID